MTTFDSQVFTVKKAVKTKEGEPCVITNERHYFEFIVLNMQRKI